MLLLFHLQNMDKTNEYFQCMRVILHIMKGFGILPFIFSHRGTSNYLFITRTIALFSISCYIPICTQQLIYVIKNVNLILVNFQFNTFIRMFPSVTGRIVFLLIPFMTWQSSTQIYNHIEKWKKLQDKLVFLQKMPYSSPLKNMIPLTSIICLTMSALILFPLKPYLDLDFMVSASTASFLYLGIALISILLYWFSNCLFVISVANQILHLIKKSITSEDEETFTSLIKFWVNLFDWNADFCSTISAMFLTILLNMIVTLVTCLYTFTYLIIVEEDKIVGLVYFTLVCSTFSVFLIFCESVHFVLKQMVFLIQEALLTTNTYYKMNLRLMEAMLIFLQTIDTKEPKITLNGFMNINRSSIISVFSTSINLLFVLKQFNRT